jgi:hypothetical protein
MEINREYFMVGAILMGLSFGGGIGWAVYGIIMSKKEQVISGVCLTSLCLIGETCLFIAYLFWNSENRERSAITTIDVREKFNNTLICLIYEGDTVHVVTDPNTPPKIVVFERHSYNLFDN